MPSYTATDDAKRAQDHTTHLNSTIHTQPQLLEPLILPLPQFLAFHGNAFKAPIVRPSPN